MFVNMFVQKGIKSKDEKIIIQKYITCTTTYLLLTNAMNSIHCLQINVWIVIRFQKDDSISNLEVQTK